MVVADVLVVDGVWTREYQRREVLSWLATICGYSHEYLSPVSP